LQLIIVNIQPIQVPTVTELTQLLNGQGNDDGQEQRLRRDITHVTVNTVEKSVAKVRRQLAR
jgi:hypothetical protein